MATSFYMVPSGTAGANDYIEITGVQIDVGSYTATTAPTFRRSGGTLQGELNACQRYYWQSSFTENYGSQGLGFGNSSTAATIMLKLPVTMRAKPTVTNYANLILNDSATNTAVTSLATISQFGSADLVALQAGVASGLTQFRPYALLNGNNTAGYIGLGAEL
jgi:hypothetical protein